MRTGAASAQCFYFFFLLTLSAITRSMKVARSLHLQLNKIAGTKELKGYFNNIYWFLTMRGVSGKMAWLTLSEITDKMFLLLSTASKSSKINQNQTPAPLHFMF